MALTANIAGADQWAEQQYDNASCMTERFGALRAIVNHQLESRDAYLADFYQRFHADDLVIDLWFSVQASSTHVTTDTIEMLLVHEDFDWNTPNRIRSVIGAFTAQPAVLWTPKGLDIYIKVIKRLDASNPVVASRMLQVLARWYTLVEPQRAMAHDKLLDLQKTATSKHVLESLESVLSAKGA